MRSTATHVFFWYGPFSNWHRPSYFSGAAALEETLQQLDKAGVAYPPRSSAITTLLAGHRYLCGEQWMMAAKAWLFDDAYILARIQAEDHPKAHKALGRKVSGFDERLLPSATLPAGGFRAEPSRRRLSSVRIGQGPGEHTAGPSFTATRNFGPDAPGAPYRAIPSQEERKM